MNGSRVDVGTPSNDFSGWTTTEVCFHNFADLTITRGKYVSSPEFSSLGYEWRSDIFPGGRENLDEGYVVIGFGNMSDKSIKIEWGVSVKDAAGKEVVHHKPFTSEFAACETNGFHHGRITSIITDILTATTREKKKSANIGEDDDLSTMRVSELREKLDEKGLDVDGSREAMIARLEDNNLE